MAKSCVPKSPKLEPKKTLYENVNINCKYKLDYPPISNSENFFLYMMPLPKIRSKSNYIQNLSSKEKLKFQCHYEERKRRLELKRKKIIQKLKRTYEIDIEGMNENLAREIITKVELIEKEKRERDKKRIERTAIMISRILEEQKYKNRGKKIFRPFRKKPQQKLTNISKEIMELTNEKGLTTLDEEEEEEEKELTQNSTDFAVVETSKSLDKLPDENEQKDDQETLFKCRDLQKTETSKADSFNKIMSKPKTTCVNIEKFLESSPKQIVFQNYERGKVYLQELKITNIGIEAIHCRYLGIVIHERGEDQFPIGVAVRDSVKLRPGLSCSTKIRLCTQDDTKELKCSVIYETRRKNTPFKHSWFFVKIRCIPLRAIARVFPLKINFPTLSWCEATGPQNAKLLNKTLKIENSGGKSCTCKISGVRLETFADEISGENVEGKFEELKREPISSNSSSNITEKKSDSSLSAKGEDFLGESFPCEESLEMAKLLVQELFENVFEVFRFSPKYYIEILPYSTLQIDIRFIPHYKGFHHESFYVQFEDCYNIKEQMIELTGDIQITPLITEPQVVDLKTCIANSGVYAGTFKIHNKSKGPYSIFLKVPSSVKKHAHVYPRATTILPLDCSEFSVRIYPRVTLARDAPLYYKEETQILEFPIFIHPANAGACRLDYIKIYVFALITDNCLELSPSFLDFGTVNTLETVRAELKLTNHSLATQEYGFLNLPKTVRVEPNMGFGKILPKECITIYVLYSPENDLIKCGKTQENHEFQLAVTSITKYGGFQEKLDSEEGSSKSCDVLCLGEDYVIEAPKLNSFCDEQPQHNQTEEDFGECDEDSSIEGEELLLKTYEEENRIREFLKDDRNKASKYSFSNKISVRSQSQISKAEDEGKQEKYFSELGEYEASEDSRWIYSLRSDLNILKCQAVVIRPCCQISETFIQLPATPCSSFSLYRFRLFCGGESLNDECFCGFHKISKKCSEKNNFLGKFEFQYSYPHIKLEPASGSLQSGDNLPITIIFKPEYPTNISQNELNHKKSEKLAIEKKSDREIHTLHSHSSTKLLKRKSVPKLKSTEFKNENSVGDAKVFELDNYELEEKSLKQLINPFYVETRIQCVIKTTQCNEQNEKTEIHEIVLVCPAIKPTFIYLGDKNQEINFNKVFVGTKAKAIVQIQNISLERISPSATFLNPVGQFYFSGGIRKVVIDPEHTWRQPLIYAPSAVKGIEKQFFEIYCNSTNISLTVSGEGIQPEYKITPSFGCCLIETKPGHSEEIKLEVENLSSIKLNLYMKTQYLKKGFQIENLAYSKEDLKAKTEKEGTKERKKSKNSGGENLKFWDEIPEQIIKALADFESVTEILNLKVFSLVGFNENEVSIPPLGKQLVKIQFTAPPVEDDTVFAIGYTLMLERVFSLKEMLVLAKISKGK